MLHLDRHVAPPQAEARQAGDSRLRALLDHAPAVIYACMPGDPQLTFVSESAWNLLGYRPEHLMGDPAFWSRHLHPDDAPGVAPSTARAFTDGQRTIEYRIRHANGGYIWVQDDLRLVRDATGEPRELVGTMVDIGARKAAEAAQGALLEELAAANHTLRQSGQMASIARLAAEVANDINNPLGFINSNLGTLQGYFTELVRLANADRQAVLDCGGNEDLRARMAQARSQADLDFVERDAHALVAESLEGVRRMRDTVRALLELSRQ